MMLMSTKFLMQLGRNTAFFAMSKSVMLMVARMFLFMLNLATKCLFTLLQISSPAVLAKVETELINSRFLILTLVCLVIVISSARYVLYMMKEFTTARSVSQ